jgi:hypothetical protein
MTHVWRAWALAVLGAWLLVSSWLLPQAIWNSVLFGALILLDGLWLALDRTHAGQGRGWVAALLSAWVALSPWLLGYGTAAAAATWSNLAVGVLGVAGGLWLALVPAVAPRPASDQPGVRKAG